MGALVATQIDMPASHVPISCDVCSRTSLVSVSGGGATSCPRCRGRAFVVPGEVYRAEDVPLFERLEAIIHAPPPDADEAAQLAASLRDAPARTQNPAPLRSPAPEVVTSL